MTDDRFFRRSGPFALGVIAGHIGAELPADASGTTEISGIAALDSAIAGDLSVFSDGAHREACRTTLASAIVTSRSLGESLGREANDNATLLVVKDPKFAFAQIAAMFYPPPKLHAGIHPRAIVEDGAEIGAGSEIAAGAVIGRRARIGARCLIDRNAVIGDGVVMGDDCYVGANSTVSHALIGSRVRIASNTSIGGEGFGFVPGPQGLLRVPQIGRVILEDHVEIGNNCAVDRGALGDTVIGAGTAIDNLVQIGHNVRIGKHCVIAGQAGVAGSAVIGDFVQIGGAVAVKDHVTVGDGARVAGRAGVMRDVAAKESVAGIPAVPVREWHRQTLAIEKMGKRKGE